MDDAKTNDPDIDEILQVANHLVQESKSSPVSGNCTAAPTSEEDNMDYDSDDDDDSKSNHSNSNNTSSRRKWQKGDMKRSHHNVLERKRRDLIKDSFSKLRDAVPTLSNGKASRAQILKKAADFIQRIHQRNESTKADIETLVKKNMELESKLAPATDQTEQAPAKPNHDDKKCLAQPSIVIEEQQVVETATTVECTVRKATG